MEFENYDREIPASVISEMSAVMTECFTPAEQEPDLASSISEKRRPVAILARSDGRAIGCKLGYERNDGVFSSWLGGVIPEFRRQGIARKLMRMQHAWCAANGYHTILTESDNAFRNMVILNLQEGFSIVGTQYSLRRGRLGILFAKVLDANESNA